MLEQLLLQLLAGRARSLGSCALWPLLSLPCSLVRVGQLLRAERLLLCERAALSAAPLTAWAAAPWGAGLLAVLARLSALAWAAQALQAARAAGAALAAAREAPQRAP
mmetsp:Transcript_5577/g.17512  ORF Transcript_5577/g.17512 Transcript_5577/m.17512 type:complete len:108 (+) Transcript_5577:1057-1380(+)